MAAHLIVGAGYIGKKIAAQLSDTVYLTSTRSVSPPYAGLGTWLTVDLDQSGDIDNLPQNIDTLIYTVPPSTNESHDVRLKRLLSLYTHIPPKQILYLSTSGVYGDCSGQWVDESRDVAPGSARAHRRCHAESLLTQFVTDHGVDCSIIRVAGIYGDNRLPLTRVNEDTLVIDPAEAPYTNRIHADDLASICIAAINKRSTYEVFNAADDHPSTMADYFTQVATIAGLPLPTCIPYSQAEERLSAAMWSYMQESRRLRNDKIKKMLGVTLRYPCLEVGLPAAYAQTEKVT